MVGGGQRPPRTRTLKIIRAFRATSTFFATSSLHAHQRRDASRGRAHGASAFQTPPRAYVRVFTRMHDAAGLALTNSPHRALADTTPGCRFVGVFSPLFINTSAHKVTNIVSRRSFGNWCGTAAVYDRSFRPLSWRGASHRLRIFV